MRAMILTRFGGPEALQLREVEPPRCGPDEVIIEVRASAVNPVDCKTRAGYQRAIIPMRPPCVLGMDVSGVILAVGQRVTRWQVGQEVVCSPDHRRQGGYAQQVAVRQDELALKPASLSHEEAASLPLVGLTAWDSLVRHGRAQAGQRVLIQAGAGGVGSIAVQLARQRGAQVLATCSARNVELVRELGAHQVIDYTRERWQDQAQGCDLIVDTLGGQALDDALRVVKPGGTVISLMSGLPEAAQRFGPYAGFASVVAQLAARMARARARGVSLKPVARRPDGQALEALMALVQGGQIRPLIEATMPLEELAQAHQVQERGRARGKIVLTVS